MEAVQVGSTVVLTGTTPEQRKRVQHALREKPKGLFKQVTGEEAADIIGVCSETVRRYAERGMIRAIKFSSRRVRYDKAEILAFARHGVDWMVL